MTLVQKRHTHLHILTDTHPTHYYTHTNDELVWL